MEVQAAPTEKVIEKIKKLLALATSDNPHEAALAASRASDLLLKHNLSMAEVEATTGKQTEEYVKDTSFAGGKKQEYNWRSYLMNHVAIHNFTKLVRTLSTASFNLIGKPSNIEVSKYLFEYLATEVVRLATQEWKQHKGKTYSSAQKWKRDFSDAAVAEIGATLKEIRRQEQTEAGTMALVVVSDKALKEAVTRFIGRTTPGRTRFSYRDTTASAAGAEAGRGIQIRQGIGGSQRSNVVGFLN